MAAAGSISAENLVPLLRLRGQLIKKACEGRQSIIMIYKCWQLLAGMLLLLGDFNKISPIVEEIKSNHPEHVCEVGAYNSPKQTLLSGDSEILGIVKI